MSKRSRRRNAALALIGAATLAGRMNNQGMKPTGAPPGAKTPSSKNRAADSGSKTMTGGKVKFTIDKDANPREIREKGDKVRSAAEKSKKAVEKRREDGDLSPTMPKTKSQADAITDNFGFGLGAKRGKMVKARGGGMAMGGMKPTKLY